MTANVGRTTSNWVSFNVDDSSGTLRTIPVDSINGVGLTYPELDLTAFQDKVRGVLPETPDCTITITGPFDTTTAQAAGTLSGSHTVLSAIAGGVTPLSLDVQMGIRHAWESGEPQFGLTASPSTGFLCLEYTVDPSAGKYSAKFRCNPGSDAPAWGTTAET